MFPSPTITAPIPLYAADVFYSEGSNEFKQLFISLHSFKPSETKTSRDSEVFTPVSRAGSGFSDSDSEEESDIFAPYREDYDFEAHIPHSMLNTIRDMLDEPERLKDSSLNPNAKPFVPNSGTLHNQALAVSEISSGPPLRPLQSSPPPLAYTYIPGLLQPSPSYSWTDIFASACLLPSTARTALSDYARDFVHSRLWNRDALAELAQHFCWKAFCPQPSQESGPTLTSARAVSKDTLAPFAAEVHRQLHLANDEETASSFVWLLKESVLGTFKATWHASESPKAISYHLTPPDSFIESGIALVSFIGDLFRARLFDEPQIALCLSILVNELVSLEHIAAISSLIKHTQALFWTYKSEGQLLTSHPDPSFGAMRVVEKPRIRTFLDRFLASAAAVRDGHSVLCKKVVPGQREQMVREVVDLLVGWSKCEGFWDDSERISGMGGILANPCALTADGGSKQAAACVIEQAHTSNYLENLPPPPGLGVGHLSLGAAGTESGFDFDGSSSGFPAVNVVLYRSRTWPNGDFHSVRQSCIDVDKNTRVSGSGW